MDKEKQKKQQDRSLIASITDSFSILLFLLFLFIALLIPILMFVGGYYVGNFDGHKISEANEEKAFLAEDRESVLAYDKFNLENELKDYKKRTGRQIFTVGIEKYIYFFNSSALIGSTRNQENELKVWALFMGKNAKEERVEIPPEGDEWIKLDGVEVKFDFSCYEPYYKTRDSFKEEQVIDHISDAFALQVRSINISK